VSQSNHVCAFAPILTSAEEPAGISDWRKTLEDAGHQFNFGDVVKKPSRGRQLVVPQDHQDDIHSEVDGFEDEDNFTPETPSKSRLPATVSPQFPVGPNASHQGPVRPKHVEFEARRQTVAPRGPAPRDLSPVDFPLDMPLNQGHQPPPPADLGNSLSRHTHYKQQVDAIPPMPGQLAIPLTNTTAKISGTQEISDTDQPAENANYPSNSAKRPHADLDYDLENLYSKTYADLAQEAFLKDPRIQPPAPQVDGYANPMTLPQRLARLSNLDQQGQATLFRSLSDAENEEVGQWFLSSLQEDLKKLMERRLERRKISLRYEMEVQKREAAVQRKRADVEGELNELKSGGGKLIEGRSAERVGTPRGK
jgi:hypothetical protein